MADDGESWEEILERIEQRQQERQQFTEKHAGRCFTADCWQGKIQALLSPSIVRPGCWRMTRFEAGVPIGHTEFRTWKEAVEEYAVHDGMDLGTVEFLT